MILLISISTISYVNKMRRIGLKGIFWRFVVYRDICLQLVKLELIPPVELDKLLSRFFMEIVRTAGVPYQLDVTKTLLDDKKYGKNILQDPVFEKSRKVLAVQRKKGETRRLWGKTKCYQRVNIR